MFRSCFESLASVVPIKMVRAAHCGAPRICSTPYIHGQLWEKNDWQFSNPRIDTGCSVVVSTSACHVAGRGSIPGPGTLLSKNMAIFIRDCVSLCLSYETLNAVGPFYLVSMPVAGNMSRPSATMTSDPSHT